MTEKQVLPKEEFNARFSEREWTAYSNEDGEPWLIFVIGHDHDLRMLKSLNCKEEIKKAFEHS